MPTNIGSDPLSGLQIGEAAIPKAYIGNDQIFPNITTISTAAYDDASIASIGGTTVYSVGGDVGSSFTLTGSVGATSPGGTQVLSTSPSAYNITIGDNSACGDVARNPVVTIAAQGASVLAGGLSSTDTIAQGQGLSWTSCTTTVALGVTNIVYNTITIGGQLYWTTGAQFLLQAILGQSGACKGVSLRPNVSITLLDTSGNPNGTDFTCSSFAADALGGATLPTACGSGIDMTSPLTNSGCTPSGGGYGCFCKSPGCTSPYPQDVSIPVQSAVNPAVQATYQYYAELNAGVNLPAIDFGFYAAVESPNTNCWQPTQLSQTYGPIYP